MSSWCQSFPNSRLAAARMVVEGKETCSKPDIAEGRGESSCLLLKSLRATSPEGSKQLEKWQGNDENWKQKWCLKRFNRASQWLISPWTEWTKNLGGKKHPTSSKLLVRAEPLAPHISANTCLLNSHCLKLEASLGKTSVSCYRSTLLHGAHGSLPIYPRWIIQPGWICCLGFHLQPVQDSLCNPLGSTHWSPNSFQKSKVLFVLWDWYLAGSMIQVSGSRYEI